VNLLAVASLLVALATGALAFFTWRLAAGTTSMAAAAQASADAAISSVRESTRARLDIRSPRVVPLLDSPQWPPLIDKTRSGMPYRNELRLLDARSLHGSPEASGEYVFDRDRDQFLWFRCRGLLRNEGSVTALVRLNGEAQFLKTSLDESEEPSGELLVPFDLSKPQLDADHLLRPGDEIHFEWGAGHSLGEWADAYERPDPPNARGALFFSITVSDPTGFSVNDAIYVVVAGRPIEPVPQASSHWRLSRPEEMGVVIYPTERIYPGEGGPPHEPPWVETYS